MIKWITIVLLFVASTASAEWVNVDSFNGAVTSLKSAQVPVDRARKNVDWLVTNGRLERIKVDRIPLLGDVPLGILGQQISKSWLIYMSGGDSLYGYKVTDGTNAVATNTSHLDSLDYRDVSFETNHVTILVNCGKLGGPDRYKDNIITDFGSTLKYELGIAHKRRAFWARTASYAAPSIGWSTQNKYNDQESSEELEGSDPITALVSFGSRLGIGRRHGWYALDGATMADFYLTPLAPRVGPTNQQTTVFNDKEGNVLFVNELGLWQFDGANCQQLHVNNSGIFSDSINWSYEGIMFAAIYDDKYWLAAPFGAGTTNNRLVVFDLAGDGISFISGINPQSLWIYKPYTGEQTFYITDVSHVGGGDAKATMWQMYTTEDSAVYSKADYRSGWYLGTSEHKQKIITQYEMTYSGATGDSIFVDFYGDFSETILWTDSFRVASTGDFTIYSPVGRAARGKTVAYGIRSPDKTVQIINFGMDVSELIDNRKQ